MSILVRTRSAAALAALLLAACTACGGEQPSHTSSSKFSASFNQRLHDDLPAQVRDRGTLRVVTDASYAPASSYAPDGRTIIGFEPDLGAALGRVLGVKVVFSNADFSTLPGLVRSGHADMIMSAMTDTVEREKLLDFVNYFSAGTALVVKRGNPNGISDLESLCGQRVAVETGTVQADLLRREQMHCATQPIRLVLEPTNDDAILQLRTGRAVALPMDFPPADDLTTQPRTRAFYQLASTTQYEPGLYGIGIAKDDQALRDVVQAALTALITSGDYRAVLQKWNVTPGAVAHASTNAAGSP